MKIIKIIRICSNSQICANGQILQGFIFIFLLGIYNLKPVALFTNSMKKCMDIENVGSIKNSGFQPGVVCLFSRVMRASDKNIHIYFSILYSYGTTFCHGQNNRITWQK